MEQKDRKIQILDAAVRRFAHFGVHKTTLTEIADDLGMTKQALAYYFPDKHSLADAVEEQIVEAFFASVQLYFDAAPDTNSALLGLIEVKKTFYEKYAMLMQAAAAELMHHTRVAQSKQKVRNRLIQLIKDQLEHGVKTGELKALDEAPVAVLLFDTMTAFEQCAVSRQAVPDAQTFNELYHRQKAVVQLMINGLKSETCKS